MKNIHLCLQLPHLELHDRQLMCLSKPLLISTIDTGPLQIHNAWPHYSQLHPQSTSGSVPRTVPHGNGIHSAVSVLPLQQGPILGSNHVIPHHAALDRGSHILTFESVHVIAAEVYPDEGHFGSMKAQVLHETKTESVAGSPLVPGLLHLVAAADCRCSSPPTAGTPCQLPQDVGVQFLE